MSESTPAIERAAKAMHDMPFQPRAYTTLDVARAGLAAALDVDEAARVLAEVLWRRESDPLERKAYTFADAPSRTHWLAAGKMQAEALRAAILGDAA